MTAISLPSDNLLELFFAHMGSLARGAKRGGEAVLPIVGATGGKFQMAAARTQFLLSINNSTKQMKSSTADMSDSAVWFRGFHAALEGPLEVSSDSIEKMLEQVDKGQAILKDYIESVRDGRKSMSDIPKSLIQPKQLWIAQSMRLESALKVAFAATEDVRGLLLERQADIDIDAGELTATFTSSAQLFAGLH